MDIDDEEIEETESDDEALLKGGFKIHDADGEEVEDELDMFGAEDEEESY